MKRLIQIFLMAGLCMTAPSQACFLTFADAGHVESVDMTMNDCSWAYTQVWKHPDGIFDHAKYDPHMAHEFDAFINGYVEGAVGWPADASTKEVHLALEDWFHSNPPTRWQSPCRVVMNEVLQDLGWI